MNRSHIRLPVVVAVMLVSLVSPTEAQPSFTEVTPTGSTLFVTDETADFWVNAVAPADVDGDGDLDLAVLGFYVVYFQSVEDRLVLFLNEGADAGGQWSFSEVAVPLEPIIAGSSDLAWGDYDGDGDADLAVGSEGDTVLYRNDGGTLSLTTAFLPGYYEDSSYTGAYDLRSITWADADNDSDLDLLVPSVLDESSFSYATKLLRNDGPDGSGGWLFADAGASIDPTVHAQSAWADDDGDSDLDLFLVNVDPYTETGFVRRFRNDGPEGFVGEDLLGIKVEYGLADWGDYDGDGDLDILVAGNIQETNGTYDTVLRVYRNDGGTYVATDLPSPPGIFWLDLHAASWADYDSDGDVDLLATGNFVGEGEIVGVSEVYGNDAGSFAPLGVLLPAPVSSVGRGGSFTWFDLDGDGDLDYFVAGAYYVPGGNGLVEADMHLYRNDAEEANLSPEAPAVLSANQVGSAIKLAWDPADDDGTPSPAITYELDVRPSGQPSGVGRRLPQPGDLGAVTDWELRGLPEGSYAWSVQAVDSAFNAGPAIESTFTIGAGADSPPAVPDGNQGTAMTVGKLGATGARLELHWDAVSCSGAGGYHLIFGPRSQLPAAPGAVYAPSGAACDLGLPPFVWIDSPDAGTDPSGLIWFVVLANDGGGTEGSWGSDGFGAERAGPGPGGASEECGIVAKDIVNGCGH